MRRLFKALSNFLVILILFSITFPVSLHGQTTNFNGVWVSESVEFYKYSDNGYDSTKVDISNMPTNYISGAFDTISISGDKYSVNIVDNITKRQSFFESDYQVNNNIITLAVMTEFSQYSILEKDDNSMMLYRKFSYVSDNINSQFGVNIKYTKK